jgi:hypothetical protein
MAEIVAGPAPTPRRQAIQAKTVPAQPVRAEVVEEDEELDDDEVPVRRKKPASQKARWRWVRIGLLITFISNCVLAGAFVLKLVVYIMLSVSIISAMSESRPTGGGSNAGDIMWRISEILAACTTVAAMVGYVFCVLGPNKHGTMGLAIATVAVAFVELLSSSIFKIPFLFDGMRQEFGFGTWFMLLLTNLFFAATVILFPLYVRAAAKARKDDDLAGSCLMLVFMAGAYAAERLITWILLYVFVKQFTGRRVVTQEEANAMLSSMRVWQVINLIMLWIGAILFAGFLVRYIILQWRMRDAVE